MVVLYLFILGLILGSFLNALAYRLHKGQNWIKGRSQCEACGHQLAGKDLVPLISWLSLKGRCRYCGKSIGWQHPAVELFAAIVFAASYIFWPVSLHMPGQTLLFAGWILTCLGLIALAIYDLNWMLLPNKIIYPTLLVAVIFRLNHIITYAPNLGSAFANWALAILVSSGLFLAIFYISQGRWIGFGDVRLGLITGTWLAAPAKALLMVFLASLLGSLVSLCLIGQGQKKLTSKIAYGPYLILATILVVLFGQSIIDWYNRLFLG